jgi:hypothetical protein
VHGAWRMALWRSADRRKPGVQGVGALLGGGGGACGCGVASSMGERGASGEGGSRSGVLFSRAQRHGRAAALSQAAGGSGWR